VYLLFSLFVLEACAQNSDSLENKNVAIVQANINQTEIIVENGKTIASRFNTPTGYVRMSIGENSFANYLRSLPLKPQF